jgi:ETC complex I subunit conserved region
MSRRRCEGDTRVITGLMIPQKRPHHCGQSARWSAAALDVAPRFGATHFHHIGELDVTAHIYQQPKNAMQSGKARSQQWVLEYLPSQAKQPDPLTGWAGSGDTRQQLRLRFPTLDAAKAYATREGIHYHVTMPAPKTLKLQAYADNFR